MYQLLGIRFFLIFIFYAIQPLNSKDAQMLVCPLVWAGQYQLGLLLKIVVFLAWADSCLSCWLFSVSEILTDVNLTLH